MRAPRRLLGTTMAAVLWGASPPARAASDDAPAAEPSPTVTSDASAGAADPRALLAHAVSLYQAGDSRGARDELQRVLAIGPDLPPAVRQDALSWLGEILLAEQGPEAARNVFEALLDEAPDFVMDPFQHSPEACAAFELVRADGRAGRLPPVVPVPTLPTERPRGPWPATALVPGGYVYFARGEALPGAVFGGVQVAGTAASAITAVQLMQARGSIREDDLEARARYTRLSTWNVLTGVVAWTAYAAPVVLETIRWGSRPPVTLRVGPGVVAGTF